MANDSRGPLRRFLLGSGEADAGLDATWWAFGAIVLGVAGVGGLVQGIWAAGLFLPLAVWVGAVTARLLRRRS